MNPYQTPAHNASTPEGTFDEWANSVFRTVIRPKVFLPLLVVIHFGASLITWVHGLVFNVGLLRLNLGLFIMLAWQAVPALLLFAAAVANTVRSIRRKRFALLATTAIYLASAGMFWYDVAHERSQMQVGIATADYWDEGGREHFYFTWWWFNDAWLR